MIWLTSCHYSKSKEIIWMISNKNLKGSLEILFFSVLQKHSNCKRAIGSTTDFKNYYVTRTYQTSLTTKLVLGFRLYKLSSHQVTRRLYNDLHFQKDHKRPGRPLWARYAFHEAPKTFRARKLFRNLAEVVYGLLLTRCFTLRWS